jgi:hypothetical protein
MSHTFILIILLLAPDGTRSPIVPTEYPTMKACMAEMKATYAAPMGKYKLIGARCEVAR